MSFNLPHRGLPQELRDMIYRHALCPPEGLTIRTEFDKRDSKKAPDLLFGCQPPIASGLLRTNRQVYDATLPVLYSRNVFTMNLSCFEVLNFLLSLPKQTGSLIKSLDLPSTLMFEYNSHYQEHAVELCEFLINDMRLQDITLAVPDDLRASTDENTGQYCWFMLTLHEALIKAFVGGHFHEIRFAHPKMYAIDLSVYEFHNVRSFIHATVLEAYPESLDEWRTALWNSYHNTQLNGITGRNTLRELQHNLWLRAGYTIGRDTNRAGEKGTVLVIRRISALQKRRHDEDGSNPEGTE